MAQSGPAQLKVPTEKIDRREGNLLAESGGLNLRMNPIVPSGPFDAAGLPRLATKREVAEFLQVTPRTVETYQRLGLPHYRLGPRRNRYDLAAVKKWLESPRGY